MYAKAMNPGRVLQVETKTEAFLNCFMVQKQLYFMSFSYTTQAAQLPKEKEHTPPSHFNLVLAMIACLVCPLLGWLSIIFACQVRQYSVHAWKHIHM